MQNKYSFESQNKTPLITEIEILKNEIRIYVSMENTIHFTVQEKLYFIAINNMQNKHT
jgi:hypothetical protein